MQITVCDLPKEVIMAGPVVITISHRLGEMTIPVDKTSFHTQIQFECTDHRTQ